MNPILLIIGGLFIVVLFFAIIKKALKLFFIVLIAFTIYNFTTNAFELKFIQKAQEVISTKIFNGIPANIGGETPDKDGNDVEEKESDFYNELDKRFNIGELVGG